MLVAPPFLLKVGGTSVLSEFTTFQNMLAISKNDLTSLQANVLPVHCSLDTLKHRSLIFCSQVPLTFCP
jgi:hypothetical protein